MKFSLLLLSSLAIGAIAVNPGAGEDENHNISKDIPLTPDEKPADAKPSPTPKATPSAALPADAGNADPSKDNVIKKLTGNIPLGKVLGG